MTATPLHEIEVAPADQQQVRVFNPDGTKVWACSTGSAATSLVQLDPATMHKHTRGL